MINTNKLDFEEFEEDGLMPLERQKPLCPVRVWAIPVTKGVVSNVTLMPRARVGDTADLDSTVSTLSALRSFELCQSQNQQVTPVRWGVSSTESRELVNP